MLEDVQDYFRQYGLLAMFAVAAVLVPISMLLLSKVGTLFRIRPQRSLPTGGRPEVGELDPEESAQHVKLSTYESGVPAYGPRWTRFNFRYYYFAIMFVIFDVETIFLFPWAARYGLLSQEFGAAALVAVLVFLAVVTLGYVYAWRKKALEWVG
ncbi:MAG: NADH-quinone oxidoreductase subunit A [Chloroflexota bacterium]